MTRSETVKLRLTTEELELYKSRAGAFGMTLSDWIRARCDSESDKLSDEDFERRVLRTEPQVPIDHTLTLTDSITAGIAPTEKAKAIFDVVDMPAQLVTEKKATPWYDSEKPRAKKMRSTMCEHRRRPAEYCVKCDS